MDSTLKVTELVTPKNKYTIFYYIIPVSFGSPYVDTRKHACQRQSIRGYRGLRQ